MRMVHDFEKTTESTSAQAYALLIELETAHAGLLHECARMQALQDGPEPRPQEWAHVRWKLSQASLRRRMLVPRIYPVALAAATPAEAERARALQAQDPAMLAASHAHIGHWTPERIAVDWAGYSNASREHRRGITERIGAEQEILVPLLRRLTGA